MFSRTIRNLAYGRNTAVKKIISPHKVSMMMTNGFQRSQSTQNLEPKMKKVSGSKNDMSP